MYHPDAYTRWNEINTSQIVTFDRGGYKREIDERDYLEKNLDYFVLKNAALSFSLVVASKMEWIGEARRTECGYLFLHKQWTTIYRMRFSLNNIQICVLYQLFQLKKDVTSVLYISRTQKHVERKPRRL